MDLVRAAGKLDSLDFSWDLAINNDEINHDRISVRKRPAFIENVKYQAQRHKNEKLNVQQNSAKPEGILHILHGSRREYANGVFILPGKFEKRSLVLLVFFLFQFIFLYYLAS